ncbi:hypothetical protein O6H91_07G024600 [Diphasiastrum complanatum]|uniref:Uncharacterized protein n=1 Tax=Diphasiastrum complanatum TaxID=34168 RepID=A0ACC2D390_DIPCM|nr:hypothetical protein O6H91_07G024600 [Diphasiastrum complanatum]
MAMAGATPPRGGGGEAYGGLWIDFLLLPERLDEHVEALKDGKVSGPSPHELISMFLEQAMANHKLVTSAPGNNALKEPEMHRTLFGLSRMQGKTASILCERAAKLAVASQFTLADVESLIASEQHQLLLLRALVKYDKSRSFMHGCNFHRWVLHKVLQTQPVGFTMKTAVSLTPVPGSFAKGDCSMAEDLLPLGFSEFSGVVESITSRDESKSLEFLEKVVANEILPIGKSNLKQGKADSHCPVGEFCKNDGLQNGESDSSKELSDEYRCQLLFDIAETHFMRGRIEKAHLLFTNCGLLLNNIYSSEIWFNSDINLLQASPVPSQKLTGFILACRGLLGSEAVLDTLDTQQSGEKDSRSFSVPSLTTPSPAQLAVFDCEQTRQYAQSKVVDLLSPPHKVLDGQVKGECFKSQASSFDRFKERISVPMDIGKAQSNGYLFMDESKYKLAEGEETSMPFYSRWNSLEVRDRESVQDQVSTSRKRPRVQEHVSNGNAVESCSDRLSKTAPSKEMEILKSENNFRTFCSDKVSKESPSFTDKTLENHMGLPTKSLAHLPTSQKDKFAGVDCRSSLLENLVGDLLHRNLSWGYRLFLETDASIPASIRCKILACNVLKGILEGASFESFLRASKHLQQNKEAIEYLFHLMERSKALNKKHHISEKLEDMKPVHQNDTQCSESGPKMSIETGKTTSNMCQFALYICSTVQSSWCWELAVKYNLVAEVEACKLMGYFNASEFIGSDRTHFTESLEQTACSSNFLQEELDTKRRMTEFPGCDLGEPLEAVFNLLESGDLYDIEAFVHEVEKVTRHTATTLNPEVDDLVCGVYEKLQSSSNSQDTIGTLRVASSQKQEYQQVPGKFVSKKTCKHEFLSNQFGASAATYAAQIASIFQHYGVAAFERRQFKVAARCCDWAKRVYERHFNSNVMSWVLYRLIGSSHNKQELELPKDYDRYCSLSSGIVESAILVFIEKDLWVHLSELCEWGSALVKHCLEAKITKKSESLDSTDAAKIDGTLVADKGELLKLSWILKVAKPLNDLVPLCEAVQSSLEIDNVKQDLAQRFEEFMCILGGMEGQHESQLAGSQCLTNLYFGTKKVPLIPRISNPRILTAMASLTAGWLHRCQMARLITVPIAWERYGVLARVTAGASLPPLAGSSSAAVSTYRASPFQVSAEFGKKLFGVLLEAILGLPGFVEGDKEKGHLWLQGLADLAFEAKDYLKSLQLFLQAGKIRSSQYLSRALSMPRDIFTPWVITRMIAASKEIGAYVQAVVLCQCLPSPDYDLAFQILQENPLITDRDATTYFPCIWEVSSKD